MSVRATASLLMTTRVVAASSAIGDGLDILDSSRSVVFDIAKGRSDGGLGGFDSNGDGDKERKP